MSMNRLACTKYNKQQFNRGLIELSDSIGSWFFLCKISRPQGIPVFLRVCGLTRYSKTVPSRLPRFEGPRDPGNQCSRAETTYVTPILNTPFSFLGQILRKSAFFGLFSFRHVELIHLDV